MRRAPAPKRGAGVLAALALAAGALFLLAPNAVGAWVGGLIGGVWATALGAITALLSGLFGAALLLT
jgi:hypothetical protein